MSVPRAVVPVVVVATTLGLSLAIHRLAEVRIATALADFRSRAGEELRDTAAALDGEIGRIRRGLATIADAAGAGAGAVLGPSLARARHGELGPAAVARVLVVRADGIVDEEKSGERPGSAAERAAVAAAVAEFRRTVPTRPVAAEAGSPMVAALPDGAGTTPVLSAADRGLVDPVVAVPVWGSDGRLSGAVAATLRADRLRRLLPEADHALVTGDGRIVARSPAGATVDRRRDRVVAGEAATDLPYSAVVPIHWSAGRDWTLWSGRPEAEFLLAPERVAARLGEFGGLGLVWSVAVAGLLLHHRLRRRRAGRDFDAELVAARIARCLDRAPAAPTPAMDEEGPASERRARIFRRDRRAGAERRVPPSTTSQPLTS